MPAAEVHLDEDLVRGLVADQHGDLAGLALRPVGSGWDNALFRLGDALVVRLPRRSLSAPLVAHELRWLPVLAPRLPLPVPAPVRVGRPGRGYPWEWTICPWLSGTAIGVGLLDDPPATAAELGAFLAALHQPAPRDAPSNPYRGVPLVERSASVHQRARALAAHVDRDQVLSCWEGLVGAPPWSGSRRWLHGDLHPGNLLVVDGRLSAVVDFGDITAGDPATDLSVAWMLFPGPARDVFRRAVGGVDDDTWRRARAWALALALAYLAQSADNPLMAGIGRRTLDAVLDDGA